MSPALAALVALLARPSAAGDGPGAVLLPESGHPNADAAGPTVVDAIVAVVGDRLVTRSDLRLEEQLTWRDPSPSRVLQARRGDTLQFLVEVAMIRGLAGDVTVYQPSRAEVDARRARLRATWDDPGAYEAFLVSNGLDEDRLAGALYARMVVEGYVRRNVEQAAAAAGEGDEQAARRYADLVRDRRHDVLVRIVGGAPGP